MLVVSAAFLALTMFVVHQTRAQTTTTVADGDVQGLIAAIEDANSSSGSATIELASSGDYQLTAEYTSGDQSGNGLPAITGEITIGGNGATIRRDQDSESFRIFEVMPDSDLHLESVTVSGGAAGFAGGGILTDRGNLTLTDSNIFSNTAGGIGGGILNIGGDLTLTDSNVFSNTAGQAGGGILTDNGNLILTDSQVIDNHASGSGGGIYSNVSVLILTDSSILNNRVGQTGGGILNNGGNLILTDSAIISNSAGIAGGGIYNSDSRATLSGSTVMGNRADSEGAGIWNVNSVVILSDSTVIGNVADFDGGGIANFDGEVTLTSSTITGNSAGWDGGGIFNDGGAVTLTDSTVSDNTGKSGGGIATSAGEVTLIGITVSSNEAMDGGGISSIGGEVTLTSSTISGNTASSGIPISEGGGIQSYGGSLTLTGSTVSDNEAVSGGGIRVGGRSTLTLTGSIVAGNTTSGSGNSASANINGSIDSNIASFIDGDPQLGPLQDNGGPTDTHLPLPGSPVLNQIPAGDHGCGIAGQMDTDQRGVPRPQGTHCDIGAVELDSDFAFDPLEQIANPWFWANWARTDLPVRDGHVSRTWMWGPGPFTTSVWEPYSPYLWNPDGLPIVMIDLPDTKREVIYFDKARMEINDPDGDTDSIWFVTNGLLVIEMITGNRQFGDDLFANYGPSQANVAGDADDINGPTYASFQNVLDAPAQSVGTLLTGQIDRTGNVTFSSSWGGYNVSVGHVDNVTDHGIAGPFWEFMNSQGLVHEDGSMVEDALFANPFYATGRPVTEAYWADVKVAGEQRDVLIQCFERRCLTYTPGNSQGFLVEAGNVGQHYYFWRYIQAPDLPLPN